MHGPAPARQERPRSGEGRRLRRRKAINPASLDALALSGAIAYIEDRASDFQQDAAAALKINPRFSGAYRVPGDLAAANYRFEEAVALSRKALEIDPNDVQRSRRSACSCCAPARRPKRERCSSKSFALDKFDQTTFNLLTMLDSLDKFETITDGDLIVKLIAGEMPVMREYVGAARAAGARDVFEEVSVHAAGADPDRDVSEARRLRRAHGRAARLDWRAWRLLRARGHARFAEGAAARRFQLGAHAVARAGARDHAAAVEAARAALAHRRHLDLRGKARLAGVGTRRGADVRRWPTARAST